MKLHRIGIKLFFAPDAAIDLAAAIAVFHRWIRDGRIPAMLIDVADYRHVPEGPGVMLIGHDVDYALDQGGGELGLLTVLKRGSASDLKGGLAEALRLALLGAVALEQEAALGTVRVRTDRLQVTLLDRLQAPNDAATRGDLQPAVESALKQILGAQSLTAEPSGDDPREALGLDISVPAAAGVADWLERIEAPAGSAG
ncbi:MAG: hypothetical protein OER86_02400 [Phycisphaerae bacterium]|nr:hypothetical protein [Phycisphaerae bacterium]